MLSEKTLLTALKDVLDPELGISIVDMGLVYNVKVDKEGNVEVFMTLTSMGCPLLGTLEEEVKNRLSEIKGVKKVAVKFTFDPPWTPQMMSKKARSKLGFL